MVLGERAGMLEGMMTTRPRRPGRPRIEIDLVRLARLADEGLRQDDIAAAFGVSQTTINTRMREAGIAAAAAGPRVGPMPSCENCGGPVPLRSRKFCGAPDCLQVARGAGGHAGLGRTLDPSRENRFSLRSYQSAELRAKAMISKDACALADPSCSGILEMTFKHSAPAEHIRIEDGPSNTGRPYYVGPNIEDGYQWLCSFHHWTTDPAHIANRAAITSRRAEYKDFGYMHDGTWAGFLRVHEQARGENDQECIEADATCKGRIQQTLNEYTPIERRWGVLDHPEKDRTKVRTYSVDPRDYTPRCQSHHTRLDHDN